MPNIAALIFSAGKGTRLKPLTDITPKPLLEIVNGKSLLDLTIESLMSVGIKEIFVNHSYATELFLKKKQEYEELCNITLLKEEEPLGQGGTILENIEKFRTYDNVLCSNGDTFTQYDRISFLNKHNSTEASLTILSDNSINTSKDILVSIGDEIKGCRINRKSFFYKKSLINFVKRTNYLGEFIFNPKNFPNEGFTKEFRGLFGVDDLIDILVNNNNKAMIHRLKVDYHLSMNTIEEYEKVKTISKELLYA